MPRGSISAYSKSIDVGNTTEVWSHDVHPDKLATEFKLSSNLAFKYQGCAKGSEHKDPMDPVDRQEVIGCSAGSETVWLMVYVEGPGYGAELASVNITVNPTAVPPTVSPPPPPTVPPTPISNRPPAFTSGPGDISVKENVTAALGTYVFSDPDNDTLTLSVGGTDKDDFSISSGGALSFISSPDYENPGDAGRNNVYNLNVIASDGKLSAQKAVIVRVQDANEPPGKMSKPTFSDIRQTSFVVNWTAPSNTGPPITSYNASSTADTQGVSKSSITTPSPERSRTISNLTQGTCYNVSVRAVNAEGEGDWSKPRRGCTLAAPTPPTPLPPTPTPVAAPAKPQNLTGIRDLDSVRHPSTGTT